VRPAFDDLAGDGRAWFPRGSERLFQREHPRVGRQKKKAIVAVGRSMLVIIWHLLSDDTTRFHDLGPGYFDSRINPERKKRNHIRELEALGYKVTLEPAA
jgi:hypothetical protein